MATWAIKVAQANVDDTGMHVEIWDLIVEFAYTAKST